MQTSASIRRTVSVLSVLVALGAGTGARGELLTATFEGPLSYVETSLSGRFAVGDLMHVSITYESATPDPWWSAVPDMGYYPAVTAFAISVAGYTASASSGYLDVFNDSGDPARDVVEATVQSFTDMVPGGPRVGTLVGDPVNGMNLWWFRLSLIDNTGTAVDSDALPMSFDVDRFDDTRLSLEWRHITDHGTFNDGILATEFTSTVVPVPPAILLGALGMATAGWICRRRKE